MKTNKSYMKRLKVTKTGKIKARKAGQNHFNAKESRNRQLGKKRSVDFIMSKKDQARYLTR
ncbi:MAG TPA: 50S ribosomal protein L35 [Candidatus Paceibacterota bacterium]